MIKSLRGMNDIGAPEIHLWHHIEALARKLYASTGFHEVRTPILESTALFKRGVGETTDIVEKEMYTFDDRNGESVSLRPEGTASIVRALVEHQWYKNSPLLKIFYFGPMFRHERPQKGRFRQHFQFGLEIFGVAGPQADVEIIATQDALFKKLNLSENITLKISSVGDGNCRPAYRDKLVEILKPQASRLCPDCQRRLDKNPLRIFDCKVEGCQAVAKTLPLMLDHLCAECGRHFESVREGLTNLGVKFEIDPGVVRGIDYYTRTSFEFVSSHIGAQGTVCGGGRYDRLVEELGGDPLPGVGCGMGVERLALLLEAETARYIPKPRVFFVTPDAQGRAFALGICHRLRSLGVYAEMDLLERSMKAQMRAADKSGATFTAIVGENEVKAGEVTLKNMADGQQTKMALSQLDAYFQGSP
jgi:histidyl-tRNA synthetase